MPKKRSLKEIDRGNSVRMMKVESFSFSFCFLVGTVLMTVLFFTNNSSSKNSQNSHEKEVWNNDDDFYVSSKSNDVNCDFPIMQAKAFEKKKNRNIDGLLDQPFIIRGMTTNWPAKENWQKHNFTQLYGNKTVHSGSESSIVYGGGSAGLKSNVRNILQDMNRCSEEHSAEHNTNNENNGTDEKTANTVGTYGGSCDNFIFDVSVLRSIPELGRDFRVPGRPLLVCSCRTFSPHYHVITMLLSSYYHVIIKLLSLHYAVRSNRCYCVRCTFILILHYFHITLFSCHLSLIPHCEP